MAESGIYHGRLKCDGSGNLLADESKLVGYKTVIVEHDELDEPVEIQVPMFKYGKNHDRPVAYHDGSYIYLKDGEDSHNERHHQAFAEFAGTTDAGNKGEAHHLEAQEGDPHYEATAPRKTRLRYDKDDVAATMTGHTDAYKDEKGGDK